MRLHSNPARAMLLGRHDILCSKTAIRRTSTALPHSRLDSEIVHQRPFHAAFMQDGVRGAIPKHHDLTASYTVSNCGSCSISPHLVALLMSAWPRFLGIPAVAFNVPMVTSTIGEVRRELTSMKPRISPLCLDHPVASPPSERSSLRETCMVAKSR
ncbi:uncharacterized protein LAESUDRAFT_433325 [Laetiporus sulphureus 93-53]|uniref:Uncharacterized protein n=1 Tax=Laetiporus sulphureus 93-53 TaxID=1314785 RepID=A0A165C5U3_9APHY|nr:uncharacterized protein LAESUDRAFT_433325 [Laetiporus sulphureus 93-53]KZT02255.1 hypothetical protein LAESUDRAFT_433325 [Laetiporus sulphureus 93-53]